MMEINVDEKKNKCPICSLNGSNGALCYDHAIMTKDYDWIRSWINGQVKVSPKLMYIIEYAISDRQSMVINDVPVVNGRMTIVETIQNSRCGVYKKRILMEIMMLEKAKRVVAEILKEGGI